MEEGGKKLLEIAPKMTRETKEPAFDLAIEIAISNHEPTEEEKDVINLSTKQEEGFIEKLVCIKKEIQSFLFEVDERFEKGRGNRAQIREALRLMLKVHIDQLERADTGLPFISHPLAVARDTLSSINESDEDARNMCIAALLHDSIEDQAVLLKLEKGIAATHGWKEKMPEEIERDGAIGGIEWLFDRRVRFLVESLTSPLKLNNSLTQEEKNQTYRNYIESIFINQDSSPSVIKWADLKQNALTIGLIRRRAEEMREEGNIELAEKLEGVYKKLKEKYKPVLEAVRKFFNDLTDEYHPLFVQRESIVNSIEEVLRIEYNT